MDPAEGAQIGPKRRAGPLTGVAVHFTSAISIIIPRPRVYAMANGGMARMAPAIALPRIGIEPRAAPRDMLRDQGGAGAHVGMVADPHALLPRLAREQPADGRTIMGLGPVPLACMGPPPGWVSGVLMRRALLPPRCGTARRLRRQYPPSQPSGPWRCGGSESAAGGYGAACVRDPTRGRGGPSARPWPSRAVTAPRSPGVAVCSRRWSLSRACHTPGRPDTGRPGHGLGYGTHATRRAHRAGTSGHPGGNAVRSNVCSCRHPITRPSESLS
jgi:hypothetical protein